MSSRILNDNEFQMWRALLAFAMTDGHLSLTEKNVLSDNLKDVTLTEPQKKILVEDMQLHRPVEELHKKINIDSYKQMFCDVARTLAWSDGSIDTQEEEILKRTDCLDDPENREFLRKSATSEIFNGYLKQYTETGHIGATKPVALFEVWV
jgi:uncharacterized membrane protein YebE (DUF533 family)